MRSSFQSDANYLLFQASDRYIKGGKKSALDSIQILVFRTGHLGNFDYTLQRRYICESKFEAR